MQGVSVTCRERLWCEGAETCLHERVQRVLGRQKVQSGRDQVKLTHSGEKQQLLLFMQVHKTIGPAGCS